VKSQGLKDGDIIILTLRRLPASDPSDRINSFPPVRQLFGYVKQTQHINPRDTEQLRPLISKSHCQYYCNCTAPGEG